MPLFSKSVLGPFYRRPPRLLFVCVSPTTRSVQKGNQNLWRFWISVSVAYAGVLLSSESLELHTTQQGYNLNDDKVLG